MQRRSAEAAPRCLREREGEVETLAEPLEGQEGVRREVAGGHLTVRLLVAARRALALKAPDQEVNAGAAVLAHSRGAASRAGGQLAVLACTHTHTHTRLHTGSSLQLTQQAGCMRHDKHAATSSFIFITFNTLPTAA